MFSSFRFLALCCVLVLLTLLHAAAARAQSEQEELVAAAEATFSNFERNPQMHWFQENIGKAKALLIAPEVIKAGFILGGSGGRAVLFARDPKGVKWYGPVFYTLITGSIGFQAGIEVSEAVTLVMTDRGLSSLLGSSFKMGGEASIAAGPVGIGARSNIRADLVAFSHAKGIYGGLNLDGTAVRVNDGWNRAYYKPGVTPPDILVLHEFSNAQGERLRMMISKAAIWKADEAGR